MPDRMAKAMLNRRLSLGTSAIRPPPGGLLAAPLVLYLIVFYAYPVLLMLQRSVYEKGWTLEVFMKLLQDSVFWRVMQITGTISLIVTVACLLLAYPVALFRTRCKQSTATLLIL